MFVSLQSLEICGLTSHLLQEFESSATSDRDRVEFSADGRYKLLEQVSRHNNKKRLNSSSITTNDKVVDEALQEQEVEIIDSD
jgi:hypothetical protein